MENQNNSKFFQFFSTGNIVGVLVVLALAGVYLRYRVNANRIRQEERAVNRIARIFRMQEDHFTRFAQPFNVDAKVEFAESLEELEESYSPSDEYYEYQMIQESPQAVIVTATAKQRGLKSFTAALFVKSGSFNRRMCETETFAMTAPEITRASDLESDCQSGSEFFVSDRFNTESQTVYEATSIGNAGCYDAGAFTVRVGEPRAILRQGHFREFLENYIKHGLLDNPTFFSRIQELRAIESSCPRRTYTNPYGECLRAGFNVSLQSPEASNNVLNFAVASYCLPLGGGARPVGAPDLYVFHSPEDSGMSIRERQISRSTTRGSIVSRPDYSFWEILMR
ncbi:MAG: type IV pilin-like G/H family protein [Phormidium sp.]